MDEIKISEVKEEIGAEEQPALPTETSDHKDGRNIFLMILIMAGIFLLFMGGFKAYDYFTGADVISLDYLHQKNSEGKLDESRGYLYNGYSFVYFDGLWWTQTMNNNVLIKIPLHFGPNDVDEIKINGKLDDLRFNKGETVYIAIDPKTASKYYTLALSELNFNVVKGIMRQPIAACIEENEICEDREILSCDNTQGKPVIELKWNNETTSEPKVTFDGSCILISGNEYGIVKAVDRVVLKWYGMMD